MDRGLKRRLIRKRLEGWLSRRERLSVAEEDAALLAIAEERMARPDRHLRPFTEFLVELER